MFSKFNSKNNMIDETVDTACLTFKIVIPNKFTSMLNDLYKKSNIEVIKMLENRNNTSSKYYKSIPCVIAKSLISKYQKNKKCLSVKNLVIPICGDKGKQIKLVSGGVRIPSIFKKEVIAITFHKDMVGFIRQVEFYKRDNIWYMSYSFNVNTKYCSIQEGSYIGVDRNSVGNVATLALPNGTTKKIGPCTQGITKNFRNRRAKLQSKGAKNALNKIKRKQSRRIKDINHKVSRTIINLAIKHRSAIILENLGSIFKKGKAKRYVQKSQWSFYQLETFIKYKAVLHSIPIHYVSAYYTSQICNKCGSINKTKGKNYKCSHCGHVAHRDSNAALNIRDRMVEQSKSHKDSLLGLIGNSLNRIDCALSDSESSDGVR